MIAERRDKNVDTARGIVCILLVIYHVVGSTRTSGLRLDDASFWRLLGDALIYIRMPMFAFLSGYIYGIRPLAGDGKRFLLGKTRRLLLPLLIVGTSYFLFQSIIPGYSAKWDLHRIFAVGNYPYWFIGSLFIIFIAIMVLEKTGLLAHQLSFSIVLASAIAVQRWIYVPENLNGSFYLFPYFLCGLACFRFRIEGNYIFFSALAIFVTAMFFAAAGLLGYVHVPGRISIIALLIGISSPFLMLRSEWHNEVLTFIGRRSYAIFLYHLFFILTTLFLLHSLNVHEVNTLVVIVTTSSGVFGSLLVERIAKRFAFTRTALLGEHWMPAVHKGNVFNRSNYDLSLLKEP